MKIKLIYLAAGNSRRFSKDGKNKLLYPLDGKAMFLHLLEKLICVCQRHTLWEIILVTQYPEICELAKELPVKIIMSKESYKGASYSIKAGIEGAGEAEGYAFFVADQPYFSEKSAEAFLETMEREAKSVPGCVRYDGREGNPVWFPEKYVPELLNLEGDTGGRKVFSKYRSQAVFYEVTEKNELKDLDYEPEEKKAERFRIYRMEKGKLTKYGSLIDALHIGAKEKPRIAAVGAGGKTSLLKELAREYKERQKKPVLITTTHMKKEESSFFTTETSLEAILAVLEKEGMVIAGEDAGRGRIKSLPEPVMKELLNLENPVLIEADGARMLPVKMPGENEPVLPKETEIVLSVYGLDAIGSRIQDVCFRPELAAKLLGKKQEDILTKEDLIQMAVAEEGDKKGILLGMESIVFLNKADGERQMQMAKKLAECLEREFGEKVCITAFRQSNRTKEEEQ